MYVMGEINRRPHPLTAVPDLKPEADTEAADKAAAERELETEDTEAGVDPF